MAGGLLVLMVAASLGILATVPGLLPSLGGDDPNGLTTVLARTIETEGIEAAVAQYRTLRAQRFHGVQENELETNRLGYVLLQKGEIESAIQVFQLNVETHPESANVYDSLAEAYLAAGNRALAVANYEKALAIDPGKKSAVSALQALTGRKRPPYSPLALFHIFNGFAGLLSGAVAMSLRKGSRWHTLAGRVFVVSMLSMSGSAAYSALVDPHGEVINVLMGVLTFYLVATAWLTARRQRPQAGLVDWVAFAVVAALAVSLANYGLAAANSPTGTIDGQPAGMFFAFGLVATFAAVLDLRMIRRGGVSGAQRLTRHLWRMCAALFIAVGSFFLGQQQFFPEAVRYTFLLAVPSLVVIASLWYWLLRVNGWWRSAARRTRVAGGAVPRQAH